MKECSPQKTRMWTTKNHEAKPRRHEGTKTRRHEGHANELMAERRRRVREARSGDADTPIAGGLSWDREQTLAVVDPFRARRGARSRRRHRARRHEGAQGRDRRSHIRRCVSLAGRRRDGLFTVADSLRAVIDKLVRRHPHVFQEDGRVHDAASKERAPSAEAALDRWNSLKAQERAASGQPHTTLGSMPEEPAVAAARLQDRQARRWRRFRLGDHDGCHRQDRRGDGGVDERRWARSPENATRAEEEMGDLLFAIANLSRKLGIEPEAALRKANDKFTKRFNTTRGEVRTSGPRPRRRDTGRDGKRVAADQVERAR